MVERRENASRFSDALKARTRKADALRPTAGVVDCTPLNAARAEGSFFEAVVRDAHACCFCGSPRTPTFEYADAEAAALQLRAYWPPAGRSPSRGGADHAREDRPVRVRGRRVRVRGVGRVEGDAEGLEATVARYLAELDASDKITLEWHEHLATPSMKMRRDPNGGRGSIGVLHLPADASSHPRTLPRVLDRGAVGPRDRDALRVRAQRRSDGGARAGHVRRARRVALLRAEPGARSRSGHLVTEEGLMSESVTHAAAGVKLLWGPALAYWTRSMGIMMGFGQHSSRRWQPYAHRPERAVSAVLLVSDALVDGWRVAPAWAKDQCYFEGGGGFWRGASSSISACCRRAYNGGTASARSACGSSFRRACVERSAPSSRRACASRGSEASRGNAVRTKCRNRDAAIFISASRGGPRTGAGPGGRQGERTKSSSTPASLASAAGLGAL